MYLLIYSLNQVAIALNTFWIYDIGEILDRHVLICNNLSIRYYQLNRIGQGGPGRFRMPSNPKWSCWVSVTVTSMADRNWSESTLCLGVLGARGNEQNRHNKPTRYSNHWTKFTTPNSSCNLLSWVYLDISEWGLWPLSWPEAPGRAASMWALFLPYPGHLRYPLWTTIMYKVFKITEVDLIWCDIPWTMKYYNFSECSAPCLDDHKLADHWPDSLIPSPW